MELNTIVCADALEYIKTLPDASVDMVFTDPPYGHNNNNNGDLIQRWEAALARPLGYGSNPRPIANDGAEANDLFKAILPELNRVLKKGSVICCCCGGGGPDPQFARWSLWIDEVFEFKQMIVWDKGPMGMGWHYRRSYETVLVAVKKGAKCRWYDDTNAVENIIRPKQGVPKIIPSADEHPTQKPVSLSDFFIRLHSQPGDLILDPFAGSGTTLVAAQQLGRHYIGCDLSAEYVEMARKRLALPFTTPMFE